MSIQRALDNAQASLTELQAAIEQARAQKDAFATLVFRARREYNNLVDRRRKWSRRDDETIERSYTEARKFGWHGTLKDWRSILGAATEAPKLPE